MGSVVDPPPPGPDLRLIPFGEQDFEPILAAVHTVEALVQWAGPHQFTFPLDRGQLRRYLALASGPAPQSRIFTAIDREGSRVGHVELGLISRENGACSLCRVLVHPRFQGRGYCRAIVREALRVAFGEIGLRRVDLRVYAFNGPALRCYQAAGFRREGLLRKAQRVGTQDWDVVLMAILREEWSGPDPAMRVA